MAPGRWSVGKPMADLFEARAETVAEQFEIVAQFLRCRREGAIGQHGSAGEIIGKADATDRARIGGAEFGLGNDRVDDLLMLDQRDLVGDLEGVRRIVGARVQRQHATDGIVAAHRVSLPAHDDADAVLLLDRVGHLAYAVARAFGHAARQLFSRHVQLVDIVVDIMEEVAHLFVRRRLGGGGARNRVVQFRQLFAGAAKRAMHGEEGMATSGALWMTSFRSCTEGCSPENSGSAKASPRSAINRSLSSFDRLAMSRANCEASASSTGAVTCRWLVSSCDR